ncbi:MAG: cytochrome d ubiquinol oxidase subunit II [Coriobacteriaceae bacterium]|nr:cytochrome d ubiquinol oxidase subunit II [Coriobacteriaceae bacterium]
MTIFNVLWFFLIFVLILGYFVLDGFDLGAGVLSPFIAKDEREKAMVRASLGPVWDGNEVWLLTAGGALFAAFPFAYATTFSGFYLAVMLVLFGLILRAVSIEYAGRDREWAGIWNALFFIGSLLPALLLGVAVGCIFQGIPMDADGNYNGIPLFGLLSPFTLCCGLFGLCLMLLQGAAWLTLKVPAGTGLYDRASGLRRPLIIASLALFVVLTFFVAGRILEMYPALAIVRYLAAIVFLACLVGAAYFAGAGQAGEFKTFLLTSLALAFIIVLLACSMFPNLVVASVDSVGPTLTLMNACATDTSLFYMTIIACIGVPLVLVYHVLVYRTFRGKIRESELEY